MADLDRHLLVVCVKQNADYQVSGGLAATSSSTNRFFIAMSAARRIPGMAINPNRLYGKRISRRRTGFILR